MTDSGSTEKEGKTSLQESSATLVNSDRCVDQENVQLDADDPLVGTVLLGKIEIRELIAEGNRGRVYKGWHRELRMEVAVKFLHEHFVDNREKILRFEREAKASSSVTHPSIVKVFDYGFAITGQPFIIMEYVAEGTLADLLKAERPDLSTFFQLFAQLVEALSHAHAEGIVHRDLKPENILISQTATETRAKIADWGIARVVFANELSPNFTGTGDILGSPAYMSPEQCLGHALDEKSDIYSLACVMYEWLTGKAAFSGRTSFDCMRMHVEDTPPSVSAVRPEVPPALDVLIAKCLAKEPSSRPGSAELRRFIELMDKGKYSEAAAALSLRRPIRPGVNRQLIIGAVITLTFFVGLWIMTGVAIRQSGPRQETNTNTVADQLHSQVPDLPVLRRMKSTASVDPDFPNQVGFLEDMIYDFKLAEMFHNANGNKVAADGARQLAEQAASRYNDAKVPSSKNPSFHLVGFYSGEPLKKFDPRGTANVRVSCKDSPVTLGLFAYSEVTWNLAMDKGVKLDRIFVIGEKPQHLKGVPVGVPVFNILDTEHKYNKMDLISSARSDRPTAYSKLAGREPDTWQSAQDAGKGTWIVGPESDGWLVQRITGALKAAHAEAIRSMGGDFIPEVRTDAVHMTFGYIEGGSALRSTFGSLVFPERLAKLVPGTNMPGSFGAKAASTPGFSYGDSVPLVEISKTLQYFTHSYQHVDEIDPVTGKRAPLDGPSEARWNYSDLALCPTPNGEGLYLKDACSLFECNDIADVHWKKLADLLPPPENQRQVLSGLANSSHEPGVYSLYDRYPHVQQGFRYLRKYSLGGKLLAEHKLSRRVGTELAGRFGDTQLLNFGRYLVAVFITTDKSYTDEFNACCYVIDPADGRVLLVGSINRRAK